MYLIPVKTVQPELGRWMRYVPVLKEVLANEEKKNAVKCYGDSELENKKTFKVFLNLTSWVLLIL